MERDPDFDLERYAKRSFGTFQEEPVEVVLRFAPGAARDASSFLFHPDQTTEPNDDESLTVRFEAGGIEEMCVAPLHVEGKRYHHRTRSSSLPSGRDVQVVIGASPGAGQTMNGQPRSADAASVSGRTGNFGVLERTRQAAFRKRLTTPSDAIGRRHDYLLSLGCEEENLYPSLRGENGAIRYFAERNIRWWQASASGDVSDGKGPTRNMASSQIACVNFLLPLVEIPGALTAVLQAIDDDVSGVVNIEHQGTPSPVELEWIGLEHALEGPSVKSRGANLDQCRCLHGRGDAQRAARLPDGMEVRRGVPARGQGCGTAGRDTAPEVRSPLRRVPVLSNGKAPFDAWLFEPFYQILRLRLLADRMVRNQELGVFDAKVVVVVPEGNRAYRERVTSPPLAMAFPDRTVSGIVEESLVHPHRGVCNGLTIELCRLRAKPVRERNGGLGSLPP